MSLVRLTSMGVLAAGACLSACAGNPEPDSGAPAPETGVAGELVRASLVSSGRERTFDIYVPAEASGPLPVVIALHGGGGNSASMVTSAGWADKAEAEGFIAVFPNGTGRMENRHTWNAGGCCAYAMTTRSADVQYISDLIDTLTAADTVDSDRIYLSGISNGGMLTFRAAAQLADRLAAAGTIVGAMFADQQQPSASLPMLMINAAHDGVVPYTGGKSPRALVSRSQSAPFLSSPEAARRWASWNGCAPTPETSRDGTVVTETYQDCAADTVFVTLEEGGHGWPGGKALRESPEQASDALNATDALWSFFEAHARNSDD